MSDATISPAYKSEHRPLGATIWFIWMVAMWVAFFMLLVADRIDDVWSWLRDLPLLAEAVLWVAFLPWMLGSAVWTNSWPDALRLLLVVCFAAGWTLISIPRKTKTAEATQPGRVRIEGDIVINCPVDEVFDFVADERNEPRYNPRMLRAEKISSGPVGLGTRFRAETTTMRRRAEMTIEITTYERPRRLASSTHLSSMDIHGTLTFEPVPEGTRMRWLWKVEPHGFFKLMNPMISRMGQRQERTIWTNLKGVLEAGEASSPAGV